MISTVRLLILFWITECKYMYNPWKNNMKTHMLFPSSQTRGLWSDNKLLICEESTAFSFPPYLPALVTIISVPSSSNSSHRDFISRCAFTFNNLGCRGFFGSSPLTSDVFSAQSSPDLQVWSPFKKSESWECLTQFSELSPWVLEITSWYSYLWES